MCLITMSLSARAAYGGGETPRLDAAEGKRQAEAAISAGEPRILYVGRYHGIDVDAKTGLPSGSLGCFRTDDVIAYQDAYNKTILRALDSGVITAPYRDRMFTADTLRAALSVAEMHTLDPGGEGVRNDALECRVVRPSSNGLCFLEVEYDAPQQWIIDGAARDLILTPGGFILRSHGECDPLLVAFVHDGRTAVFKHRDADRAFTYDLERGRVIQTIWLGE